jgi:hypothetical protein
MHEPKWVQALVADGPRLQGELNALVTPASLLPPRRDRRNTNVTWHLGPEEPPDGPAGAEICSETKRLDLTP